MKRVLLISCELLLIAIAIGLIAAILLPVRVGASPDVVKRDLSGFRGRPR